MASSNGTATTKALGNIPDRMLDASSSKVDESLLARLYGRNRMPPEAYAGGKDMSEHPTKDEMKAEIGRSVAEIETKMVRIEGQINTALTSISAKLDSLSESLRESRAVSTTEAKETQKIARESRNWTIGTVVASAFALAGLVLGIIVYGDAIFSRGMQVRDVVNALAIEMQKSQPKAPQQ